MRKNVAGQTISANMVAVADGSAVTTGTTTVYVTKDGGTQESVGTATHKGNGEWSITPAQADTNGNHLAFTWINASAVPLTVNVYTTSLDPHDTVRAGQTALPNAAAGANGGVPVIGTGTNQFKSDSAANMTVAGYGTGAAPLQPTVAGRTLDVSAGGEAGIDLANVGSPTATLNLSGTTIKTATDVEADTADIQARLPAALVGGRMDASVGAMGADTLTAAALATDAVNEIKSGLSTLDAAGVRAALGMSAASLDAQLSTIAGYIDTEINTIISGTNAVLADTSALLARLTATRASLMDNLAQLDAAITSRAAAADYTSGRAAKLDNLDAAISTRQATVTFPANFAALAITVAGKVTAGTVDDKTGFALSAAGNEAAADALLARNVAGGSNTGRTVKQAFYRLRNRNAISGGNLSVYEPDDNTVSWNAAVATAPGDPVTSVDPS
ncbi:MAG: hypothetical protein SFV21_00165 [Rhodospirillaceae bacterium]|nr:hypothetical protein [Rhodospirillaceae bacterium]